ncbi:ComF family protein [Cyanobium sp. ATX 6E8]|uniref:ComF family protein n=1 Tax=Cyanobium sp. ATX 6E8 TaxID=2823701 RepID=UPI0020CE77A5|nr:phosphoribosyltransferase family protein [Cyanobium sp. ATX 6E8]MCP9943385.1 ComF family protein [Cyanobium sp. ATX 6E8]
MAAWPTGPSPLAAGLLRLLPLHWIAQPPKLHADLAAALPPGGFQGAGPLRWWAAGLYEGDVRRQLLQLRKQPQPPLVGVLAEHLADALAAEAWEQPPLLVPIPSWKQRANPLPGLLGRALSWRLGWQQSPLLERSRAVLGQHHLGRELRWANQAGAFRCVAPETLRRRPRPPVLLIDDILTTGATACAAASALREQGWCVAGMACLARTPWQRRDLRSKSRYGDRPG